MLYNTYLFANLVNDLIININDWSIPYDLSYTIVLQAYEEFMNFDFDVNLSTHDSMVNFINSNEELYSSLRDLAE